MQGGDHRRGHGQRRQREPGHDTLSANLSTKSASATLTVAPATVLTLAVTPASQCIAAGTTQQFVATVTFTNSTAQDLSGASRGHPAVTFSGTATDAIDPKVAVMAVVPTATVVANPFEFVALLLVAAAAVLDAQGACVVRS